jgi:hypothetical protein
LPALEQQQRQRQPIAMIEKDTDLVGCMPSAPNFLSRQRAELGESERCHRSALRTFR